MLPFVHCLARPVRFREAYQEAPAGRRFPAEGPVSVEAVRVSIWCGAPPRQSFLPVKRTIAELSERSKNAWAGMVLVATLLTHAVLASGRSRP